MGELVLINIKLKILEKEWMEFDNDKRLKIIELMDEYGYDTVSLKILQETHGNQIPFSTYSQFYGDDE